MDLRIALSAFLLVNAVSSIARAECEGCLASQPPCPAPETGWTAANMECEVILTSGWTFDEAPSCEGTSSGNGWVSECTSAIESLVCVPPENQDPAPDPVCCSTRPDAYGGGYSDCVRTVLQCKETLCHSAQGCELAPIPIATIHGYADSGGTCPLCSGPGGGPLGDDVCSNGLDDDCDGSLDEADCLEDVPCDEQDQTDAGGSSRTATGDTAAQCGATCRMRGAPVDLWSGEMYVGPHRIAAIQTDGESDLDFGVLYDSKRVVRELNILNAPASIDDPGNYDLGPGFRHTFSDRLILKLGRTGLGFPGSYQANPNVVVWDTLDAVHRFYGSNTFYDAEPGLSAQLVRDGTTWRLLTSDGDVLEFVVPSTETFNHPNDAVYDGSDDVKLTHARLQTIFRNGAPDRKIVLLYEGDTGLGDACTNLVSDHPTNPNCLAGRGLLVKIGLQYFDAGSWREGPSIELSYDHKPETTSAYEQYTIKLLRAGADRADGLAISDLAELDFTTGAQPAQLRFVYSRVGCTGTGAACRIVEYSYDATQRLSQVLRPVYYKSGGSPALAMAREEEFTYYNGRVDVHKSPGIVLDRQNEVAGVAQPTMTWIRNAAPAFDFQFDERGNPLKCSDGSCGDPLTDKEYATEELASTAVYTLGPTRTENADQTWTMRRYTSQGNIDFECHVAPTDTNAPSCTLGGGTVSKSANAEVLRAERRYYDTVLGEERLRVIAVYDPDASPTTFAFPTSASPQWTTDALEDLSGCPTISGTVGADKYSVMVFDYDSNNNGNLNETGATGPPFQKPDTAIVRINHVAEHLNNINRICTIADRDLFGLVTTLKKYAYTGTTAPFMTVGSRG